MKKVLLVLTAAAFGLAGCSKEESAPIAGEKQVRIDPTIVSRATEVDFETGDRIGLTIAASDEALGSENNCLTFDEATGVFSSDLKWFSKEGATATLSAYYPYDEAGVPMTFAVKADQTAAADYAASDFMTAAKADVEPTASAVGMTFRHRMTKLLIRVNNTTGTKVARIVVGNFCGTAAVDVAAGTVTADAASEKIDAAANAVEADKTYRVLVVPQAAALSVTVEMADGKSMTQQQTMTELKSGGQYAVALELADDSFDVTISGDIENWTDEGTIEPEPVVDFEEGATSFTYAGETYGFKTLKDGCTWMTENLRYVPAGKTPSADPKEEAGIWYPQTVVETDGTYAAAVSTDAAYIAQAGYYYDFRTAVGVEAITEANSTTFEGAQGICPAGWHIPTGAEFTALVAAYKSTDGKTYWTDLDEDGFNTALTQLRMRNTTAQTGSYSGAVNASNHRFSGGWLMSSTANTTAGNNWKVNETSGAVTSQNKALMFLNTYNANTEVNNVSMSVANASNFAGLPVRCVRDTAK